MSRKLLLFFLILGLAQVANATHNRAGEITYKHVSGLTYEITITTFTKESSEPADRCELEVKFGDGDLDTIPRINGPAAADCIHIGVLLGGDIKENIYQTTHTYPGPGTYVISMNDPNRNADVLNIPNSVNTSFYIESMLIISPFGGDNCSPTLTNPPVDNGCVFAPYLHNPGAVDADGDILKYSIVQSLGENGTIIPDYIFPDEYPNPNDPLNALTIEENTGTLIWDAPQAQGEYNVAIKIEEFRNGVLIGYVIRDLQITIEACNNDPPVIQEVDMVCVTAGDLLSLEVIATDENEDFVTLTATGAPFLVDNPATFQQTIVESDSVTGLLTWQTDCNHVRAGSYQVVIKAADNNGGVSLVDFSTIDVKVVSPAPTNPSALPAGNSMNLDWDAVICQNAIGYRIYRSLDSIGYVADECVTGVPASTGYSHIATLSGHGTTTYVDDDNGQGLNQGQEYCYMVTAYFEDGAESYPTLEFCGELMRDLPVPTRVTILTTDATAGTDSVTWTAPTELDLTQYPGPYEYVLYRGMGHGDAPEQIASFGPENNLNELDSAFQDNNINTLDTGWTYRVELISGGVSVGISQPATSIFLTATPSDNTLTLEWESSTPWENDWYFVYRRTPATAQWTLLDSTQTPSYADTGLTNGRELCYFVRGRGSFSAPGFVTPVINHSQELCTSAQDTEPPCPPGALLGSGDCIIGETSLEWTNPNNDCANDVIGYRVYYTPIAGQPFQLLAQTGSPTDTTLFRENLASIAGCYAVAAVDSFYNESALSDTFCIDNCPIYELPNVFTPGADGFNDLFVPFPYRHVERINLVVYNRWGEQVFAANDPNILWDGTNDTNGREVPSGVYYYVCDVFELRVLGVVQRQLKGFVQVINEKDGVNTN